MNLRPRRREEPEINLVPMIDVVLVLLIFFMVATSLRHVAELEATADALRSELASAGSAVEKAASLGGGQ